MKCLLLALVVLATGCTQRTKYGPCWGLAETQDPKLEYDVDVGNVVVGVLLSETIIVPVWVAGDMLKCPVGRK